MKKYLPLALLAFLVACASQNKIENQVTTIGKPGDVEITNLTKTKDITTGNMVVRWNFAVTGNKPEQVFWRCEFVDANGFAVGDPQRFVEATIYPQQPTPETCVYPSESAVDFKINFQNIATNMTVYH